MRLQIPYYFDLFLKRMSDKQNWLKNYGITSIEDPKKKKRSVLKKHKIEKLATKRVEKTIKKDPKKVPRKKVPVEKKPEEKKPAEIKKRYAISNNKVYLAEKGEKGYHVKRRISTGQRRNIHVKNTYASEEAAKRRLSTKKVKKPKTKVLEKKTTRKRS